MFIRETGRATPVEVSDLSTLHVARYYILYTHPPKVSGLFSTHIYPAMDDLTLQI